ncbi:MAG: Flp family type IVb pilin [Panacagrimonas sp.]
MFKKIIARHQEGASAIEYALIAGLIALAIILGAGALGTGLSTKFNAIDTEVQNAGT